MGAGGLLVLFVLLAGLVLLDYMTHVVGWENWAKVVRARRAVRGLVRERVREARVRSFGATHLSNKLLCLGIDVPTDAERDQLRSDTGFLEEARQQLRKIGYPEHAIPFVEFSVESQETVDRDFDGSWTRARKQPAR